MKKIFYPFFLSIILMLHCTLHSFATTETIQTGDTVISVASILPVSSTGMRAAYNVADKSVNVNWSSYNNTSIHYFEIQRSKNGKDFSTIAVVFSEELADKASYKYVDARPLELTGYYRIRIVHHALSDAYSNIANVNPKETVTEKVTLLANPAYSNINFEYRSKLKEDISVRLVTMGGKLVMNRRLVVQEGVNVVSLGNYAQLADGVYVLAITDKNKVTGTYKISFIK